MDAKDGDDYNWILRPISLNAMFRKNIVFNDETAKYWVKLVVDDFSINLKKKELLNLIKIMEFITEYRKFQDSYNRTLKYKFLRPYYRILDTEKDKTCKDYHVNPNARLWWKYVIDCVRRTVKMKNGAPNQFKLSSKAKEALGKQYKYYFNRLFAHKQELKETSDSHGGESPMLSDTEDEDDLKPEIKKIERSVLDINERNHYDYILTAMDLPTLKNWTSTVVKKHYEKFKESEEQRRSKSGSLWSYFSWMASSEEEETKTQDNEEQSVMFDQSEFHISEDEIEDIHKIVQNNLEGMTEDDLNEQNLMFEIHYVCVKGEFHIEDDFETNSSGVIIKYEQCTFDVRKRISREFEFLSSMRSLTADLFLQTPHNLQIVYLPLVRNGVDKNESSFEEECVNNIYELTITRNKAGSVVDLEFEFVIKPIYFYYRALLLKIVKSFTSLGARSSEELKVTAWDKFYEVKDNTNTVIKSTLLTTTNTVNCMIQSPKLILPFSQNNDLNTPAYVLCLGNVMLNRDQENAFEKDYELLNVSVKGTQLQYFESLALWQKYELDSLRVSLKDDKIFNGLNKQVFNVIEELEIYATIGRRKKPEQWTIKDLEKAHLTIEGKVSDIRVNMTSERYNSLINFQKMIEITGKNLSSKIMLHEKQDILDAAAKSGLVRKQGATLQYWNRQYAVLSGSYLYFYNEDIDNSDTYESWFYLKDALVEPYEDDELQNVFYLMNDKEHLFIYTQDEETMKVWIKEIRNKIYDINSMTEDYGSANHQQEHTTSYNSRASAFDKPDAKLFNIDLKFENLEYTMINNDFSKFINLKISEMNLNASSVTKVDIDPESSTVIAFDNKISTIIDVDAKKIKVSDLSNGLVIFESFNKVQSSIKILNKASSLYKGDSLVISFDFDMVAVNFLPETIKKMIRFLKDTDYKDFDKSKVNMSRNASYIREESKDGRPELRSRQMSSVSNTESYNEDNFGMVGSKSILKLFLSFTNAQLNWINPMTKEPFTHIYASQLRPTYELKQGLHTLDITCEDMPIAAESPIFGMFNLMTMNPSNRQTFDAGNKPEIEHAFDLHCEFYGEEVLVEGKKQPNKINLKLDELTLFYQQENVFRIKDYFFDQFLDAIIADLPPENNGDKWYNRKDSDLKSSDYKERDLTELGYGRKTGLYVDENDDPDLHQSSHIEIYIHKPKILIKDRPHFDEAIVFETSCIKMNNSIELSAGRWYEMPEKSCIES